MALITVDEDSIKSMYNRARDELIYFGCEISTKELIRNNQTIVILEYIFGPEFFKKDSN